MDHGKPYYFSVIKPISLGLEGEAWDLPEEIREHIPDWLSYKVSANILYTIICWKQKAPALDLEINIPSHWVAREEHYKYYGATLFGRPIRIVDGIFQPQVAVNVKEKPER